MTCMNLQNGDICYIDGALIYRASDILLALRETVGIYGI